MDIADYWLLEKELVHKLFKVLVPRYENSQSSVTRMMNAPKPQYARVLDKVVLELKQNPYPDLYIKQSNNKYSIQNVLLDAAKQDYRQSKMREMAKSIGEAEKQTNENCPIEIKKSNKTSHIDGDVRQTKDNDMKNE